MHRRLLATVVALFAYSTTFADTSIQYQIAGDIGAPAQYGLEQLQKQLNAKGIELRSSDDPTQTQLVIGTQADSPPIRELVEKKLIDLNQSQESLAVKRFDTDRGKRLVIAGYDSIGLMYALLDLADAVEHSEKLADWPNSVPERSESPRNGMRRMRILMHHKENEDWYRSQEFWDWYIGMLATNRFNGLNLVYSHQTSYMAPMYAWHVTVDKFPGVKPTDITEEERAHNLEIIRYVAKTCRDRGIELTIGVWQHLPWKESYLESREDQESFVEGLDHTNVAEYSYLAVQKLLEECPGIARIQIRPNDESGIHLDEQTAFYRDNVMRAIKESPSGAKLDLRLVGARESTVKAAREADLDVRTSQKFYGEFLAMPFTPIDAMTSGYSYSDTLRKPLPNPVYNEVWMLGSHRVLLWGSEDYGRRFGRNASYGGMIGFETDGPNAQKGFQDAHSPAWRLFKHTNDEYFTHEIERYWAFFRTVGRFGYNPDADREVWLRPFRKRFGPAAESMADAYEAASQVIGLICASHVSNVNMYIWPEINMGGVIPLYNNLRGTDKVMFPSINDQVRAEMEGKQIGAMGANRLAAKFDEIADNVDQALKSADGFTTNPSKEYTATSRDFQILADLARYHACREREGYLIAKYMATGDGSLLPKARKECVASIDAWKDIREIADEHYYDKMMTAMVENGHWKDKTFLIESNLDYIDQAIDLLKTHGAFDYGFDFGGQSDTDRMPVFYPQSARNHYWNAPRFIGLHSDSAYDATRGFGFTKRDGLKTQRMPRVDNNNMSGMRPDPDKPLALDVLHRDFVHSEKPFRFRVDLWPMDTHKFTFVFADRSGKPKDRGPMELWSVGRHWNEELHDDISVPAGDITYRQSTRRIRRAWYPFWEFEMQPGEDGEAMLSALTVHRDAPAIAHAKPTRIDPKQTTSLSATITLPPEPVKDKENALSASSKDRLAEATLFYRTDPDNEFKAAKLSTDDGIVYRESFGPATSTAGELQYFFRAVDRNGRVTQLPDATAAEPYFRVPLTSDDTPPKLVHKPIETARSGKPLPIEATVTDPSGVKAVRVCFRPMTQYIPYQTLTLQREGDRYVGTIPAETISGRYDFVYYFEAVDNAGNAAIYPDWEVENPYVMVPVGE